MVTLPSESFDGTTDVMFEAIDGLLDYNMSTSARDEHKDAHADYNSAPAHEVQDRGRLRLSGRVSTSGGSLSTVSSNFTFYHCGPGSFWDFTPASGNRSDISGGTCRVCMEDIYGAPEVCIGVGRGGWGALCLVCMDRLDLSCSIAVRLSTPNCVHTVMNGDISPFRARYLPYDNACAYGKENLRLDFA